MNKHIKLVIGIAAGIIGAVVARDKALETVDIIEKTFKKKSS